MPAERILPAQFMHVSKEIRDYLALMWKIPRSGITEIRDQEVLSDGHTYDDLKVITLDLMCEYVGSNETFARAWELTIAKAYSDLHPPVGIIGAKVEVESDKDSAEEISSEIAQDNTLVSKRRGRPAKSE